jgi:hypothetical protein
MKKLALLVLVFISLKGTAQYSIAHIAAVYDYLHSTECKSAIEQLSDQRTEKDIREYPAIRKRAKAYRKEQKGLVLFWTSPGKCFIRGNTYFIPDSTSGERRNDRDSIMGFNRFISKKIDTSLAISPRVGCAGEMTTRFYYLTPEIVEVRYFPDWEAPVKFGYEDILRFKIDKNGVVQFVSIHGIHHN